MNTNELKNDIIEKRKITTWEQRKQEKIRKNFLEAIKKYEIKEEISMKDLATIDRIEGSYAVCELLDGKMINISIRDFKENVSEGDIFDLKIKLEKGQTRYSVGEKNTAEMEIRRKQILEKLNRIKK